MTIEMMVLYLLAITVVIAVPGPLSLFMVGNAVQYGVWQSWPGFIGGVLASVSLLLLSALGIGSLLLASPSMFLLLQLFGACYLLYLGLRTWQGRMKSIELKTGGLPIGTKLFSKAFLLGISNPKDIVFFLALLPQFLMPARPLFPQLVWMVVGWMLVDFFCKFGYGLLASYLLTKMAGLRKFFLVISSLCFSLIGAVLLVQTVVHTLY
ncbi:LysE family translocator [Aquitalea sp. LB_tupeE]|uniref:LysE family translocator n=1 Tax=Aquitalea sp. LB_tupeE TaxID=2748078 RepID=UPI0015C02DC5|nr:LysE family translocator [Aquitalea sp. LB_tupeE]NWK78562.1 LysE family translocator [Aquitalea sp. LB_tupeE]